MDNEIVHSDNFDKAKNYFDQGLWNEKRIKNLVQAGLLTKEEYQEITGKSFNNNNNNNNS